MADGAAAGEWDYQKWGVAGEHKELSVTENLQALGKDPLWMCVDVNVPLSQPQCSTQFMKGGWRSTLLTEMAIGRQEENLLSGWGLSQRLLHYNTSSTSHTGGHAPEGQDHLG